MNEKEMNETYRMNNRQINDQTQWCRIFLKKNYIDIEEVN